MTYASQKLHIQLNVWMIQVNVQVLSEFCIILCLLACHCEDQVIVMN